MKGTLFKFLICSFQFDVSKFVAMHASNIYSSSSHTHLELPDSAYYIPNFLNPEDEMYILDKVYAAPKPKWKTLSNRRLQNWGGLPHPKGMIQEDMPQWLQSCIQKITELGVFADKPPNHVLVNEYLPGQGIMPHEDGPLFYPVIATLNLGSPTVLNYYKKSSEEISAEETNKSDSRFIGSLLLERLSLLIVKDDLYDKYLHGIEEKKSDTLNSDIKNLKFCINQCGHTINRDTRISLTIRHVPNAKKTKFLFK